MGQPKPAVPIAASRSRAALLAVLVAAFVLLGGPTPSAAQTGPVANSVRKELDRTEALIAKAREEVSEVRNDYARDRLRKAVEVQRDAMEQFRHGTAAGYRNAQSLTRSARGLALQAIEAAGIEKRALETVGATIDRAQDRAAEIAPLVKDSGRPLARRMLEQGLQQIRRARRAFQEGDPQAARIATLALHLIDRAESAAAGAGATLPAAEISIERSEALIAEVEARVADEGGPAQLKALLEEARTFLEQARRELGASRPWVAFRLSVAARERGLEALTKLRQTPEPADVLSMLEDIEALHEETAPGIAASGRPAAQGLLRQARELLAKARGQLDAGKPGECLATLVAAESVLRSAAEAAGVE